jgi:hypothetical protein
VLNVWGISRFDVVIILVFDQNSWGLAAEHQPNPVGSAPLIASDDGLASPGITAQGTNPS